MWVAVKNGRLTMEEILAAETQHWIRTQLGRKLRKEALRSAKVANAKVFGALLQTYLEECTDKCGPSHLDLVERLLVGGGMSKEDISQSVPTPGNSAAIALYRDIGSRGAACHMLGAGVVEHYYSCLCPSIFKCYTEIYGMSPDQAETYRIHGDMDKQHAMRAFEILDDAVSLHGWANIELSVRDAFVATSLHYDGMLQAATGCMSYWSGGNK